MGHQVNFYATRADVQSIELAIRRLGPMLVLHDRSWDRRPRVVDSLDVEQDGKRWLFFFLVRPEDLPQVQLRHVPAQGYWCIDVTESPVVEFHCPFDSEELMRRGRAYYVDAYYGADDSLVPKSNEFRMWGKRILAAMRKALVKHGMDYIGRGAKSRLESSATCKLEI